jgi:hypothetical protein
MDPNGFWFFQIKDLINAFILVATIVAIWRGPITAINYSKEREERERIYRQKKDVLISLMKTRRLHVDPERVAALNLIQLFFSDEKDVMASYKAYIEHLGTPPPTYPEQQDYFYKSGDRIYNDLCYYVATSLNYTFDKKDLEDLSYAPKGWANDQNAVKKYTICSLSCWSSELR